MRAGGLVVVLEDEPILGFALEDMLTELGDWEVEVLTHLDQADAFLDRRTPNLAILDVNIHGRLSYGFADRLLAAGVPYLFATGYGDQTHPEAHLEAPTVTKPYTIQDIDRAIGAALAR
jgi:DNA-binding response OmpR family regulator